MTKRDSMAAKSDQELMKLLAETKNSLRTERFAAAGARPKDSNAPRKLRKAVARILTEQHVRTLSINGRHA